MAAALLFNIIFYILTTTSSILTRIIFTLTAHLLVLLIQAFKVPGESIKNGMDTFGESLKSWVEYIVGLILENSSTIISTAIELLFQYLTGSVTGMASGLLVVIQKMREGFTTDLPEIIQGFAEMIFTIVVDFWNNSKDAFQYVTENALA
ncbi:hypothetical protein ACFE04_000320 [Oxalis oulophora]